MSENNIKPTPSSSTAQVNTQLQEQTSKPLDGASCSASYRDESGDGPYMVIGYDETTDPYTIVEYAIGDEKKWEGSGYEFVGDDLLKNGKRVGKVERNWMLVNFDPTGE